MIKFKSVNKKVVSSIEFDEYIPFTVDFENKSISSPIYWRVGNGTTSLLEVGINKDSGQIASLCLTCIDIKHISLVDDDFLIVLPCEEGIPIADMTNWDCGDFASKFIDDFSKNIKLEIGRGYLLLSNLNVNKPTKFITHDDIIFGVDDELNLSEIILVGISDTNMKKIMLSVEC